MENLKLSNEIMKKTILLLAAIPMLFSDSVLAQSIKRMNDCTGIKTFVANKGDTVLFNCDSVRLYNQASFLNLKTNYERLYETSNALLIKSDSASFIFKNLYEEKSKAYDALQQSYSQFRLKTENHLLATDTNILAIKSNTLNAKMQVQKADSLIVTGIQKIEDFNRNQWKTKVKYAGWGFVGGILTAVVLSIVL